MFFNVAYKLNYYIVHPEINYVFHFIFSGVIGCGYFHSCRNFSSEVSDMVKKLVPTGRILWQWTKVWITEKALSSSVCLSSLQEGAPAHSKGGAKWSLGSLPDQTSLWFYLSRLSSYPLRITVGERIWKVPDLRIYDKWMIVSFHSFL